MNLYEVANGWMGESYVRVYVWCEDEETALRMALERYRSNPREITDELYIKKLLSSDDLPFATIPNDGGWVVADYTDPSQGQKFNVASDGTITKA